MKRFAKTYCSQCGGEFGPGDSGYSHCDQHRNSGLPEIIVCAGPPLCSLEDDAAVENSKAGCPHCRHIVIHRDGSETEYRRPVQ